MDYFFPFTPQHLQTFLRYYFPFLIFQHLVVWISSHILIFLQHFFPPFSSVFYHHYQLQSLTMIAGVHFTTNIH